MTLEQWQQKVTDGVHAKIRRDIADFQAAIGIGPIEVRPDQLLQRLPMPQIPPAVAR